MTNDFGTELLARYYKNALSQSIHGAQADQDENDIDAYAFWIDAMLKGATRDGVYNELNLPEV